MNCEGNCIGGLEMSYFKLVCVCVWACVCVCVFVCGCMLQDNYNCILEGANELKLMGKSNSIIFFYIWMLYPSAYFA